MNPGVSFAMTTFLPSRRSANSRTVATTAGSVWSVGMISSSGRYLGGLKKWVPSQCRRKSAAAPLGEAGNRKPRRVGTDDRSVAAQRVDSLEKRPLRVGPFDDGFDNPVGLSNPLEVRLEASRSDASGGVSREKWVGFERSCAFESVARGLRAIRRAGRLGTLHYRDVRRFARPWFRRRGRRPTVFDEEKTAFLPCYTLVASLYLEVISMGRRFALALAASCLCLSTIAAGQTRATTADLGGTIVDQSSSVLPARR